MAARRTAVAAAALALLFSANAQAYRPFDGTDADVAKLREIELEMGPLGYLRDGRVPAVVAPAFIFNWGFARDLELVAQFENAVAFAPGARPHDLLIDPELNLKWVMRRGCLQARRGPSIALETGMLIPSSDEPGAGVAADLIASQQFFGDALTAHLNFQPAVDRDHRAGLFASLILEGPRDWRIRPVSEFLVDRASGVTRGSGLLGWIWPVSEHVALDSGVRLGYGNDFEAELRLGLTVAFSTDREAPNLTGSARDLRGLFAPFGVAYGR